MLGLLAMWQRQVRVADSSAVDVSSVKSLEAIPTHDFPAKSAAAEGLNLPKISRTLYKQEPIRYARWAKDCGVAETFPSSLVETISELAEMRYDDDFIPILNSLTAPGLRDNSDAKAFVGLLYKQHLIEDVAGTLESDRLAYSYISDAARNGSEFGEFVLWELDDEFPGQPPLEQVYIRERAWEDQSNWEQPTGLWRKFGYQASVAMGTDGYKDDFFSIEDLEQTHLDLLAKCNVSDTATSYAFFLETNYGIASEEVRNKIISLLEAHPNDAEANHYLGQFYETGSFFGGATAFTESFIDLPRAYEYFLKGAALGDPDSAWKAYTALDGFTMPRDEDLELALLEFGASSNEWYALDELANVYASGDFFDSVGQNLFLAGQYFKHIFDHIYPKNIDSVQMADALINVIGYMSAESDPTKELLELGISLSEDLISILEEESSFFAESRLLLAQERLNYFSSSITSLVASSSEQEELLALDFGNYYALIIGNDNYQYLPNLSSAVADATLVANKLSSDYGFEVTLLTDATRSEIISTLNSFRSSLSSNDNFLLYYAGHGQIDAETEEGFWQPVDALNNDDTDWISNDRITRTLRGFDSANIFVVADSCYSGVVLRSPTQFESQSELLSADYISRLIQSKTRIALTSGGVEPVLDSLPGTDNSIFALSFLNTLDRNDALITASDIYRSVSQDVVSSLASLGISQTPEFAGLLRSGHEGGDFVFRRLGNTN